MPGLKQKMEQFSLIQYIRSVQRAIVLHQNTFGETPNTLYMSYSMQQLVSSSCEEYILECHSTGKEERISKFFGLNVKIADGNELTWAVACEHTLVMEE